jgi:heme/copper-type cytochrome/quinol oxidase subunit 3
MAHDLLPMNESGHPSHNHTGWETRTINNACLATLILLGAEIMFFAGLIGTFLVFRVGSITWPPPSQIDVRLPIGVTGINTIILLLSGYTMFQALRAIRKDRQKELRNWLFVTGLLGVIFLVVQGSEWAHLVHHGLTLSSGVYGSIFYVLIGCHALHVLIAVLWLLTVFVRATVGRFGASHHVGVEVCAIYWGFVVALWPVLYVLVYLI